MGSLSTVSGLESTLPLLELLLFPVQPISGILTASYDELYFFSPLFYFGFQLFLLGNEAQIAFVTGIHCWVG